MQVQAEEQGHVAARAQAAEMQAQVAQMQVHAAQMQVHAAQMQIRATEMQGQAAEMQASALSIRAQASTLSFADLTNTAANAMMPITGNVSSQEAGAAAAGSGPISAIEEQVAGEQVELSETSSPAAQRVRAEDVGRQMNDLHHDSVSAPGGRLESGLARAAAYVAPAAATSSTAETMRASGTAAGAWEAGAAGAEGQPPPQRQIDTSEPALTPSSGNAMAASARFEAVREETARLTRYLLTAFLWVRFSCVVLRGMLLVRQVSTEVS